jgi:hypothetical protein
VINIFCFTRALNQVAILSAAFDNMEREARELRAYLKEREEQVFAVSDRAHQVVLGFVSGLV